MTADQLRQFKHNVPFEPFTIHMTGGEKLIVDDPESLVLPRDWTTDAIVTMPRGKFAFVYLRNVSHVESQGGFPKVKRRPNRGKDNDQG